MMKEALEVDHPRQWPEAFALVAGVLILLSKGAGFTPSDQMDIRHKQCSRRQRGHRTLCNTCPSTTLSHV